MIELSPEELQAFKKIYKEETGKELSDKNAHKYAMMIVELAACVLFPDKHKPP